MRQSRTQALGAGLALLAIGAGVAAIAAGQQRKARRRTRATYDYSDRSGFPRPAHEMRGIAAAPRRSLTEASSVQPAALRHS